MFLTFSKILLQNISTEDYEIWRIHARYHVEILGQPRIVVGRLDNGTILKEQQDVLEVLKRTHTTEDALQ